MESNERKTKTRTVSDYSNIRAAPLKMFATDRTGKDTVADYNIFARKRPQKMNQEHAPFYLAINNTFEADVLARKGWLKSGTAGV